ncbi:hypothetical protein [Halobaculum sp. MBLA0143]|uniref:DUF7097 family protein n=1 Tax=Halobaculum sp. MBLA0143 TaxID=3079933 RepID=UPI0035266D80
MEETPDGTPVGVDDPYDHAGRCDHLTNDGRCRYALDHAGEDRAFAAERRREEYACVAADDGADWQDCPHYRSTTDGRECRRCGLSEVRMAHDDSRPLVEEHHLSYGGGDGETAHEITVALCRWCHAKVHDGWARVDDDVEPAAEAVAAREARRSEELDEAGFSTAAERFDTDGG